MGDIQNYLISWEEYETGDTGLCMLEGMEEVCDYLVGKFDRQASDIYKDLLSTGVWFGEYYEVTMKKTNWVDKERQRSE